MVAQQGSTMAPQPMPYPTSQNIDRLKPENLQRLRRQVFTIAKWAHKKHFDVVETWADDAVDFLGEQMLDIASKMSHLRADIAAAEAEKAELRSQLEQALHQEAVHDSTAASQNNLDEVTEIDLNDD